MILSATVVVALLCWQTAECGGARRARWLAGLYAALGVGVLAKGLVPLVLAGLPIAAVTLRDHGWPGFARLRPGLGLLVLAAIVVPWHVAAALRHPGFAWDYVGNQHLLFFLDRKLPRDSEGDSLPFFFAAPPGRAAPWVLLVPLTLGEAVRGAARRAAPAAQAAFLLWAWAGGLLLFFSCAPSRLEHYAVPALPAAALLAARGWQRARAGELGRTAWVYLVAGGALVAGVGVAGLLAGRAVLARTYWLAPRPRLPALPPPPPPAVAGAGRARAPPRRPGATGPPAWCPHPSTSSAASVIDGFSPASPPTPADRRAARRGHVLAGGGARRKELHPDPGDHHRPERGQHDRAARRVPLPRREGA